ncbi:MAG TPA: gephyrin-like molybdotransferase Glp [Chloroflexota bacterium]|nr:gephyrin-like molybdotransferase Glp [Chloroflexota bacterium]
MQASRYPMVSAETAIETILSMTPVLDPEEVSLQAAIGRVLAETVIAQDDMPPFAASAVDGYALRVDDGLAPRRVLTEIIAGATTETPVTPGTASRIMTGAPVPAGADAVIMVEQTNESDGFVQIDVVPRNGDNVYPRGLDITNGQTVLAEGTNLGAAELGLLATVGRTRVSVYRRPVVAILSTGDELIEPDEPLRAGSIRDSNRYALFGAIQEAGGVPLSIGKVHDDEAAQEALIRVGLNQADVVLTSGGVSVGSRDLIKPILARIGTIHFGRIAFKPGKPTTFATVDTKLVFGLPGFPVSSLVSFEVFVRPALQRMQGRHHVHRPVVQAIIEHSLTPSADRTEFQRARVRWSQGRLIAAATGAQRSSRLLSLVGANALLRIPPGSETITAGSFVEAHLVGELLDEG